MSRERKNTNRRGRFDGSADAGGSAGAGSVEASVQGEPGQEQPLTIWERLRARPWLVAVLMGLTGMLLVAGGAVRAGVAWDEPHTVWPGMFYTEWLFGLPKTLTVEAINRYWRFNFQHPPLAKMLMGIAGYLLSPFTYPLFAGRLVSVLTYGAVVGLLYYFVRKEVGGRIALYSTIAFLLLPRVAAQAQFATLDTMMMLTWFLASWAFYEGMKEPRRALWFALAFGLALLTKLNSFFLPFILFTWAVVRIGRQVEAVVILGGLLIAAALAVLSVPTPLWVMVVALGVIAGLRLIGGRRVLEVGTRLGLAVFIVTSACMFRGLGVLMGRAMPWLKAASAASMLLWMVPVAAVGTWVVLRRSRPGTPLANLVAMTTISPVIFLLGWPWLWPRPVERLAQYLTYHGGGILVSWIDPNYVQFFTQRILIPVYYLRTAYVDQVAPWHYPWVLVVATTPVVLVWPLLTGALRALRRSLSDAFLGFVIIQVVGILFIHSLPRVPKYDGVRLFLPVFPFLAVLIGVGVERFFQRRRLYEPYGPHWLWLVTGLLVLIQTTVLLFWQPFGTAYYSWTVAGVRGAHYLGLETSYWGEGFDWEMMRALEDRYRPGDRVVFVCIGEFVPTMLKDMGALPEDLEVMPLQAFRTGEATYAVVAQREGWLLREGLNPKFIERLAPLKSTVAGSTIICRLITAGQLRGGVRKPVLTTGGLDTSEESDLE